MEKKFDHLYKEEAMKKEKHPVYRWLMAFLLLLLLAGFILLVYGVRSGPGILFQPGQYSV